MRKRTPEDYYVHSTVYELGGDPTDNCYPVFRKDSVTIPFFDEVPRSH